VDRVFEPRSDKTKDYSICYFSPKIAALRSTRKDRLARNHDNMCSKWSDMSTW